MIQEAGLVHFVYRTDREEAIVDLLREAVRERGRPGRPVEDEHDPDDLAAHSQLEQPQAETPPMTPTLFAVPEHCAVG